MPRVKEIVGIALALLGCITAIVACVLPMWKVSTDPEAGTGNNTDTGQIIWEGLWMRCILNRTGPRQCKAYDSMQTLPSGLQVARDMTVISIIMALLPLTLSIMGAPCTNCIENKASRAKVVNLSGFLFILSGCLMVIPVYLARSSTIQDKELGASLYLGFAAAGLLITGGFLLCCTCPSRKERGRASTNTYHARSVNIVGFTLILIAWILAMVACFLPMWIVVTSSGSPTFYAGLMTSCVTQSTGQLKCEFNLRALGFKISDLKDIYSPLITATVMPVEILNNFIRRSKGFIRVGMCIKIKASISNIMIMCGAYSIIAGISLAIPVYEIAIIIDYLPELDKTKHYDIGASIYVGFAAAALYGIGGVLLCSNCCTRKRN